MDEHIENYRRLIKDVDAAQRFREILFYQRQISNSTYLAYILLRFPLSILLTLLTNDSMFILKLLL